MLENKKFFYPEFCLRASMLEVWLWWTVLLKQELSQGNEYVYFSFTIALTTKLYKTYDVIAPLLKACICSSIPYNALRVEEKIQIWLFRDKVPNFRGKTKQKNLYFKSISWRGDTYIFKDHRQSIRLIPANSENKNED